MSAPPAGFAEWTQEKRDAFFAEEARTYRERQSSEATARQPLHVVEPMDPPDTYNLPGDLIHVASPNRETTTTWPAPKPLPSGLLPVAQFDLAFLPMSIGPWVADIADRMQCPPDFVAVPAVVALGSVIGRKVGIRPQRRTDWIEVPNQWGLIVGRPGAMKSPAAAEALKPSHRLEAEARRDNDVGTSKLSRRNRRSIRSPKTRPRRPHALRSRRVRTLRPRSTLTSQKSRRRSVTSSTIRHTRPWVKFSRTTPMASWRSATNWFRS